MEQNIINLLTEIKTIYASPNGFIFIMIIISLLSVCTLTMFGLCICLRCKSKNIK
jgi:hypothetical protein